MLSEKLAELQFQGRVTNAEGGRAGGVSPPMPPNHQGADVPCSPRRRSGLKRGVILAVGLLVLVVGAVGTIAYVMHNPNPVTNPGDTKPVAEATNDGTVIDLIPLARPDPALGNWKREGDTLVCTPREDRGIQYLPIPVELPREYELEAVLERLAGDDFISFHMAAFGSTFFVGCDAWAGKGSWSGLGYIEGKDVLDNETGIRGAQINIGKQYTFRCTVRASGIVATLDDKPLFNYTGGFDKLDAKLPVVRRAKFYAVVHGTVGCQVHRLRLTQLAPEDKTNTPPPAAPPSSSWEVRGKPSAPSPR